MWERQYERAQWNGLKLNLLSTAFDGGKRLQVSDLPHADLPHIKVMGSKARNYTIEAVFVGEGSLTDANALIKSMESTPQGQLEHPWLGELSLLFQDFSQSISTKKGVVTLSLKFVRAGTSPSITAATSVRAKAQSDVVESLSKASFADAVKGLDVSSISQVQGDTAHLLDVLVDITHRLNLSNDLLQEISSVINEAYSAVSSLSTHPNGFADHLSSAVDVVARAVQSEPDSKNEAVDNARSAQALLLGEVKSNSPVQHHNVQVITGVVKANKDIVELEKSETFDITQSAKQPALIHGDLEKVVDAIDVCIKEVTQTSALESVALFDELFALKGAVQRQSDKVLAGTTAHKVVSTPQFAPALVIAHEQYAQEASVTKMNALQHPLFLIGDIAIRGDL
ncbi:DNA circularization N-terminal domain-containing protein [Vibrio sp. 10N.261.46.A3]|uniref:DNA circularization N-terminal domain-containing protein n=1 Tax=Vibrio sp. 10N.261.46.A3 TaxID=3229658 RepID=UPI00354BB947